MKAQNDDLRRYGWLGILAGAILLGSAVFSCATPFPALGALAALHLTRRDAFILTIFMWATNQAIGFGFLHYPQTWSTVAWGAAIGLAAAGSTAAAIWIERFVPATKGLIIAAFGAAFVAYEGLLFAATVISSSGFSSFSPRIMSLIFIVNVLAFGALLLLQRAGEWLHIAPRRALPATA